MCGFNPRSGHHKKTNGYDTNPPRPPLKKSPLTLVVAIANANRRGLLFYPPSSPHLHPPRSPCGQDGMFSSIPCGLEALTSYGELEGLAAHPETNAAHDLGQFGARFGTPLTYQLSKLAHCMQKPGDILRAFIFMLRAWDMAAPSTSDACAMTASGRGRTGTDDTQAESRVFCSHATYARARLIFDAPS